MWMETEMKLKMGGGWRGMVGGEIIGADRPIPMKFARIRSVSSSTRDQTPAVDARHAERQTDPPPIGAGRPHPHPHPHPKGVASFSDPRRRQRHFQRNTHITDNPPRILGSPHHDPTQPKTNRRKPPKTPKKTNGKIREETAHLRTIRIRPPTAHRQQTGPVMSELERFVCRRSFVYVPAAHPGITIQRTIQHANRPFVHPHTDRQHRPRTRPEHASSISRSR